MRILVILISVFVGLLLLAAAIIGVFWWYMGADLAAAVESGTADGVRYGEDHDDTACRDRGIVLMAECDGFVCGIYDQSFLSACLSRASSGSLCEQIPKDLGFSSGVVWISKQCEELAQQDSECASMMQHVLEYCAK